ncbi:MAG: hypothetical protein PHX44_02995 [Sulfurimonas sp.]|uniref:hypothetical protein n=1 Tax=Sulfurimonas sp. TaxID=2022749 RepID=UPI0026021A87|nr:hypothetical protein [Sulfurimonas sp.]MDD2652005.1 hypothetical protein [Sulfurimonas sp.]MDD3451869.1 hypothetical protein [Sulfurimonas sp.]
MKSLLLFLPLLLWAQSPFETSKKNMDMSAYETKKSEANLQASQNIKIKCRLVCDKKVYKEQTIADAIEFYKKSKEFSRD